LKGIISFVKRLKINVLEVDSQKESPIYWLEQLSKIENFKDIDDPVAWQINTRKERKLPFRN